MPPGVPVGTLAIGQAGADQCGAACGERLGAERSDARQPARSMAAAPDRRRRRSSRRIRRVSAAAPVLEARGHDRHPRRRPARPHAGACRGAARLQVPCLLAQSRTRPPSTSCIASPAPTTPTREALDRFAGDVDVVTYEFENVPAETATFLAARVPVLPDPKVLATTQDRLAEKNFVAGLGIRTAPFADVGDAGRRSTAAIERIGRPAVLKTRRFGYDGKGQATIKNGTDPRGRLARRRRPALHSRSLRAVRARSLGGRRARP